MASSASAPERPKRRRSRTGLALTRHPGLRIDLPLEALTARERQVLGLVVDGQTDREVAAQLQLTSRTIALHLRRAISKLGLASRADLIEAVAGGDDDPGPADAALVPRARPDWAAQQRTLFLLDNFGGVTKLADALDVSKSQPSRWKTGEEVPGPEAATRLLDLDHVFAFGMQAWAPNVVSDWLESPNGFLDGAHPIDVMRLRGSAEVIDALRAAIGGAYA